MTFAQSPAPPQEVIDALANQVAVLDHEGRIVMVNRAWNRFALNNGLADLARVGEGQDYLAVARRAAREGDGLAEQALLGLTGVLAGMRQAFRLEYPCHSPEEKRWFIMIATPLGRPPRGAVTSHLDITRRKLAEMEQEALAERLRSALRQVKTLQGLLRICSHCNRIQEADGTWSKLEHYLAKHAAAELSHGLCPECIQKHYNQGKDPAPEG